MSIERLMADHAHWSDERARLKREGQDAASRCARMNGIGLPDTCIEIVFKGFLDDKAEGMPLGERSFEGAWGEAVSAGEVCEHCQLVRALKRQRMYAGRRLGAVRSAITRIGRKLRANSGRAA